MAGSYQDVDTESEMDEDTQANLCCPHPLSAALSIIGFPCWLTSIRTIEQNEQAAVMTWGQYRGSIVEPGLQIINPCGVELRKISTARQTLDIQNLKCTDARGSPIFVSGNVVYRIYSAKKAKVDVKDATKYLHEQSPMVLRRVCAKFPYESSSGPSLRGGRGSMEDHVVGNELRKELQTVVHDAGIEVIKCDLTDLSYAPEIAAAMLQKQQAEAMIEARELVVQSAVDISSAAIRRMREKGHQLTPQGEERIIGNLLTVICGDRGVQTTLPV
mmetsp:Transcript_246/g.711  ORF Transcript_246/g.711 Transcript_246/m.711 type:complete len:273 (-) Transcript_246:222-1040(-)